MTKDDHSVTKDGHRVTNRMHNDLENLELSGNFEKPLKVRK